MKNEVKIGSKTIGPKHTVKFISELGVNHLGNFETAIKMIDSAIKAGSDFLKFQTYRSEHRYDRKTNPKADLFIKNLSEWEFSREKEEELWKYAKKRGAQVFTSPFDIESLEFSEKMNSLAYKIAAFEINNHELINEICKTKKPILISRGMCTLEEMDDVVNIFEKNSCKYIILHTISSYPLRKIDSNLNMIHTLKLRYNCPIGHSDHTFGTEIPPLAVAAGADIIEKHFTTTPKLRESDNFFSVTEEEVKEIKFKIDQVRQYMGSGSISKIPTEDYMWDFRRNKK
jgi:N,N'-diacetyllegionaminate synthase